MFLIETQNLTKVYRPGKKQVSALNGITLQIERGTILFIKGRSGSGKTTFLNMIGCLDRPTGGEYLLDGERVSDLKDDQLASIRNQKVGFVFQTFNLLPRASALSNVELPMRYSANKKNRKKRALSALEAVGLSDRVRHKPNELSGGQQQRVAIARALVNEPAIILADEPTGNLDTSSGDEIMELLLSLNKDHGTTLVIVTHDPEIASQTGRVIHILDGVVEDKE